MFKGVTSIIFLITALLLGLFWVKPVYSDIQKLKFDKEEYEKAYNDSRDLQKKRDEMISTKKEISDDNLVRLGRILPTGYDSVKFIIEVEQMIRNRGMLLKSINIGENGEKQSINNNKNEIQAPENNEKLYVTVPVVISTFGSYRSLRDFLDDLEHNLRLVEIESISFTAGETDSYEINIIASIYKSI